MRQTCVTRRWKASLTHGNGKCPQDLKRDAMVAWRKFVACLEALPADQAAPLWQTVQAQAMIALAMPEREPVTVAAACAR
jgi:hypothetical protein